MAQGDITPPKESSGGIFDEWKKASPKEKLFIGGAIAAVLLIMLYMYNKSKGRSGGVPAGGAGTGGGGGGIQTVPTSSGGQVPILPTGLCPVYNPITGSLESYAPCGAKTGGTGSPNPPTSPPSGKPLPPTKPGTTGKPALPLSPVVRPRPLRQPTTVATVASGRGGTTSAPTRTTPVRSGPGPGGVYGKTRGNAGNQPGSNLPGGNSIQPLSGNTIGGFKPTPVPVSPPSIPVQGRKY